MLSCASATAQGRSNGHSRCCTTSRKRNSGHQIIRVAKFRKQTSDICKWLLARKMVNGLNSQVLGPALGVLEEASTQGELEAQIEAVKKAMSTVARASSFLKEFPASGASCSDNTWVDALPTFLVTDYIPVLKRVMHGKIDTTLTALLTHPPRGGWTSLNYNDHMKNVDCLVAPMKKIEEALVEWNMSVKGITKSVGGAVGPPALADGHGVEADKDTGEVEVEDGEDNATASQIHESMTRQAQENCQALVSMCVAPGNAKDSENLIRASGVYQKLSSGPPPHRIIFAYSVSDACDRRPPRVGESDRRRTACSPIWTRDFSNFIEVVGPFVTPENQHFLAVLSGSNMRPGSGLLTEAGLGNSHEIITLVRKASAKETGADGDTSGAGTPPWRVKTFSVNVSEDSFWGGRVKHRRGVSGSLNQTLFFSIGGFGHATCHKRGDLSSVG